MFASTFTKRLIQRVDLGVVMGAADDDPSGIATSSQAGAHAGFGLLWTVVLTWPLMVAVRSISARIGRVAGRGLSSKMLRVFPRPVIGAAVLALPTERHIAVPSRPSSWPGPPQSRLQSSLLVILGRAQRMQWRSVAALHDHGRNQ